MRIQLKLIAAENEEVTCSLPFDFRRHFISLLKTLLSDSKLYSRFTSEQSGYSPYVFAVSFNKILTIDTDKKEILIKLPVYMTISSGFYEVITQIVNSSIKMRNAPIILGLKIQDVDILPNYKINTNEAEFRINRHAVFRGIEDYLDGSNVQLLEESINQHTINKFSFFNQLPFTLQEEYQLSTIHVMDESNYKKGVCHHYGGLITTLQGRIYLKANRKTLQFLHDFGIGVRSGQGFGLLEVIK
ncbi:MAG TPA: CRISPR-associated endoribonuclease Cas6 [Syntrophomonadaceae bacterium]|nr:CRISPR-associated endoribonuclease Cas6 [Syntrophomonadaceae bacterium]